MTMQGVILGTAAYMAPEQAKGKPVDRRADIWAFGCVVYEMLTGQRAFKGEDVTDTIAAVVTKEPDWTRLPASTPASVERLLRRCLQKRIANRLPHIGVARIELADPGTDEVLTPLTSPPRPRVGHLAAAVLAGISATAVVAWLLWPAPSTDASPAPMQLAVPGLDPASGSNGVLLSPDGRYLVTRGASGASVLHALDGSPSRPLGGVALCWSPDSRSLVLRRGADGELLRMDLDGAPGSRVHDGARPGSRLHVEPSGCPSTRRPTRVLPRHDLRRHAHPGRIGRCHKCRAAGGPRFLSDGRHFLYWAVTADGQRTVRVGTLDRRETRADRGI